jgi:predicted permease
LQLSWVDLFDYSPWPALVMPFLLAFSIVGVPRQMGVLMSALPIALSCYVLSVQFDHQVQHAAIMVIVTTILMLPTQLMWIAITNAMGWSA